MKWHRPTRVESEFESHRGHTWTFERTALPRGWEPERRVRNWDMAAMEFRAFPAHAGAVGAARRWVQELLRCWALPVPTTEDAALLTSELATNAVIHARSPFDVTVHHDRRVLRVTVADDVHHLPALREQPTAEGGRGLRLVQALASDWGCEPVPGDGKVVWFEVPS